MKRHYVCNHPHRHGPTAAQLRGRQWGESGVRGVYQTPQGRYQAKVQIDGVMHRAGTFDTREEAERAVRRREAEVLGREEVRES